MSAVLQLLFELMILITAAKLAGLISVRLGQPAVLGEIIAGLILGPSLLNLPGWSFMTDRHLPAVIAELAEIGVIFLMFIAGLEADLEQMRRAGRVVLLAGVLGVFVPLLMGMGTALPFGYNITQAVAIGMLLTATSVSISAQTLLELRVLRSKEGVALLGAAAVDDVVVILAVSIFVALAKGGGGHALDILLLIGQIVVYLVVFGLMGWFILPRLLSRVSKMPISQGVLAAAVVMALFYAWGAEVIGRLAMITGAFMAGIFAARSPVRHTIFEGISSLTYGFFVPIFFVNIGLQANIWNLQGGLIWLTVLITVVAVLSKVLGSGLGALVGGFTPGESLRLGVGMISRGEVGLIVATLLVDNRVVTQDIITVAVLMVLITTLVTPPLLRLVFAGRPRAEKKAFEAGAVRSPQASDVSTVRKR
jgi:Kef-type K+ transport system membrane component KefB